MAEQEQPVQRRVALKIIKPGLDSRQVIARLEAERQALALMDHPNIAKFLDAGATTQGRPYFVMELVKGHRERNHQGLENRLIEAEEEVGRRDGEVQCRERLGGLLRYYHRKAA